MPEHVLAGCRPEPLGAYLRALGAFRLASEQLDPQARGCWQDAGFVLSTSATAEELVDFFLQEWQPSPLVSPWNNGAGFAAGGKSPAAVAAVTAIERSTVSRLAPYRSSIAAARHVVEQPLDKEGIIKECRAWLPDVALPWLDAAVVLTEGGPVFPPLLGSGGNLGRLELSVNFMQHLAKVIGLDGNARVPRESREWLRSALFGGDPPRLIAASSGQYDPGRSGGVNSSALGDAGGIVNPWEFVLSLEGTLAFASAAARRMGSTVTGKAAMPFTVDSTPVGYVDACSEEGTRGELWAPLWVRPARWLEISRLLSEGRAQWGRGQARSGLDFVRATASLGVDRGVHQFVRHAIVERLGQSMLAVPVGRVDVRVKPEVPVLREVDRWVEWVNRAGEAPSAVRSAVHHLEAAQFEVAVRGGGLRLQEVLTTLAQLEKAVSRATAFRDRGGIRPVTGLSGADWLPHLEAEGGASLELRLAAALASLYDPMRSGRPTTLMERRGSRLGLFLRPVELGERGRLIWAPGGSSVPGLTERPLADVLADVHRERMLRVTQAGEDLLSEERQVGVQSAFARGLTVPYQDLVQFVEGDVDDRRIARILAGLLLLDWSRFDWAKSPWRAWAPLPGGSRVTPPALAVLAPFFNRAGSNGRPQSGWVTRLASDQVSGVLADALRRLGMLGDREVVVRDAGAMASGIDGARLAGALLVRLSSGGYHALLERVAPPKLDPYSSPSVPSNEERMQVT